MCSWTHNSNTLLAKKLDTAPMKKLSLNDVLAANLAKLMDQHGHKQASLAKLSGIGQTTISLYLNPGRRQPSKSGKLPSAKLSEVEVLADVLGVAPWELLSPQDKPIPEKQGASSPASLPKRGAVFVPGPDVDDPFPMAPIAGFTDIEEPRASYPALRLSKDQSLAVNVAPGRPFAANDKFEDVPELGDVRLAAGEGIENHTEEPTGVMHFRQSFLRSVGADRGNARVVYATGDSMEPIIRDGVALLLVLDEGLTLRKVAVGGIYAINYDGTILVKAIAKDKLTGRWVARSFDPSYPDIPLKGDASVVVLGMIAWSGAMLPNAENA